MFVSDLNACYAECGTCNEKLGTRIDFKDKVNSLLTRLKDEKYADLVFDIFSPDIQT